MLLPRQAAVRAAAAALAAHWGGGTPVALIAQAALPPYAEIPLGLCGGGYCLTYSVDGQLFRAVVDTGSPFLIVDGTCKAGDQGRWGCYYGDARPAALADSELSFAGQDVGVQWRRGSFALTLEPVPTEEIVGEPLAVDDLAFGIVRSYRGKGGSGAVFVGLVKERGPRVRRPTFLEQTNVVSMRHVVSIAWSTGLTSYTGSPAHPCTHCRRACDSTSCGGGCCSLEPLSSVAPPMPSPSSICGLVRQT
jgi:hypothetical protein